MNSIDVPIKIVEKEVAPGLLAPPPDNEEDEDEEGSQC